MSHPIVIIGASHAGITCAEKLRQYGFAGKIVMMDSVQGMPYQRPPLSKTYLSADAEAEDGFYLRPQSWFDSQNITLMTGTNAASIDTENSQIHISDGQTIQYQKLVLATGAVPRKLPDEMQQLDGVALLRTVDDARQIKRCLTDGLNGQIISSAVIVGGGYIGLEIAASLKKMQIEVHLVEMSDRVLARVASPPLSAYCQQLHQAHGVRLNIAEGLKAINAASGQVDSVSLTSGQIIEAQLVIVGIGVVPDTVLAEDAGLNVDNGILVSQEYVTSHPDIYAIGDVARAPEHAPVRVESVHHAQFSATIAAAHICEAQPGRVEAWWFWSDQYDVKFQLAGLLPSGENSLVHITRTGRKENSLSVWSFDDGRLVSVEAANDAQAYMVGKYCLEQQISPDMDSLADAGFDLKSLMKR